MSVPSTLFETIMNRRAKWGDALRNGGYLQVAGKLHKLQGSKHSYCCLGVACEVFSEDLSLENRVFSEAYEYRVKDKLGSWQRAYLPRELREYLGLSSEDQAVLVSLNDAGVSFDIIANVIMSMGIKLP